MPSFKHRLIEGLANLVRRFFSVRLDLLMRRFSIDPRGVLHVGGNVGSEAETYHNCGFQRVVWVEGYEEFYRLLVKNIERFPEQLAFNILVSDTEGEEVKFRIANNTGSSTVFEPAADFGRNFAGIQFVETKVLRAQRLDNFFEKEGVDLSGLNLLVLDVEGSELKAMKSLGDGLGGFGWILTEVSIGPNFVGGPMLWDLDRFLASRGFYRKATAICRSSGDALYGRHSSILAKTWARCTARLYGPIYRLGYFHLITASLHALQKMYHKLAGK